MAETTYPPGLRTISRSIQTQLKIGDILVTGRLPFGIRKPCLVLGITRVTSTSCVNARGRDAILVRLQ